MTFELRRQLVNDRIADKMWKNSGRDYTINFHLDTRGLTHAKGEKMSNQEVNFARNLFRQVEKITGIRFTETGYQKADTIIGCTNGSKWSQETKNKKYWSESFYEDEGGNKLTSFEKLNIAACVLRPLGLDPVDNKKYDTFDTVMSWNGDQYFGLRGSDIDALQNLW